MIDLSLLFIGLLIGAIVSWIVSKYKFAADQNYLSTEELKENYVLKEVFDNLQVQADLQRDDLQEKEQEFRTLMSQLAAKEQSALHLEDKLLSQKEELNQLQDKFKLEFENIANRLLEEKSQKFTDQNQKQLKDILHPLQEKIKEFEVGIEKRFWEDSKDRVSFQKEIEHLRNLNMQLSEDANNLVSALKGESKTQGDWGEFRLEMLLEKAGLIKGIHFESQSNFKDDQGRDKRPDFIINLPDEKHLIIDSKVSLVAYERFFNADKEKKKEKYIKAHLDSIRAHIKDLSSKNYQHLYQINSPDYILLFIPIEPAFSLAIQAEKQIFLDALDKNIVLVTGSTLLATMRTVSYIWKQDKQKRNVLEIARQSGLLYDRFCNFVNDLKTIGTKLDQAQTVYDDAMNKLTDGKRYGDTLIGRAEKIKQLGAKTSKNLPEQLINLAGEQEEA
ncbi:MAG: DNA recombination protein RmuC [Saprospiraceae bacterium]